jgi:hypothetical protein
MKTITILSLLALSTSAFSVEIAKSLSSPILSNQGNLIEATDFNASLYCKSKGYKLKSQDIQIEEMTMNEYFAIEIHPNGDDISNTLYYPGSKKVQVISGLTCFLDI